MMWQRILGGLRLLIIILLIAVGVLWIATNLAGWIQGPAPIIEP